jgi:hypothetical protein
MSLTSKEIEALFSWMRFDDFRVEITAEPIDEKGFLPPAGPSKNAHVGKHEIPK